MIEALTFLGVTKFLIMKLSEFRHWEEYNMALYNLLFFFEITVIKVSIEESLFLCQPLEVFFLTIFCDSFVN